MHQDLNRDLTHIDLIVRLDQMVQDLTALLYHERHGPAEQVHEVRKQVGMRSLYELLNVQGVVLN